MLGGARPSPSLSTVESSMRNLLLTMVRPGREHEAVELNTEPFRPGHGLHQGRPLPYDAVLTAPLTSFSPPAEAAYRGVALGAIDFIKEDLCPMMPC